MSSMSIELSHLYCMNGDEPDICEWYVNHLQDLVISDQIPDLEMKIQSLRLSKNEIDIISDYFSETMECGALCKYLFLDHKPREFELNPDYLIENTPGIKEAQLIEREEDVENRRYTISNLEINTFKWEKYWIIECYFSH